jgi:hypothetical protein
MDISILPLKTLKEVFAKPRHSGFYGRIIKNLNKKVILSIIQSDLIIDLKAPP